MFSSNEARVTRYPDSHSPDLEQASRTIDKAPVWFNQHPGNYEKRHGFQRYVTISVPLRLL